MHRTRVGPCTRADVSAGVRAQSIRKVRPVPFGARRYPGIVRPNPYHRTVRFPVPSVGTRQVSGTIISQLWEANPNLAGAKVISFPIGLWPRASAPHAGYAAVTTPPVDRLHVGAARREAARTHSLPAEVYGCRRSAAQGSRRVPLPPLS